MLNNVSLMGRLTDAPELKQTPAGVPVMRFCLASTGWEKNEDGTRKANFIDCIAWREQAEFIRRNFNKGNLIAITGELTTTTYTDKVGATRKWTEVRIKSVDFTGEKTEPQ